MTMTLRSALLALALVSAPAMPALGQDRTDLVGSYNDWDAFTLARPGGEKVCYMVSVPKSWKASREGAARGDIYITVTHRPKAAVRDQINIVLGYPLEDGSQVIATIDGKTGFKLFTRGDGAWLYTAREDSDMTAALRRGNALVVEGKSSRGTTTTDRYSLSGFTAAYNAISRACP